MTCVSIYKNIYEIVIIILYRLVTATFIYYELEIISRNLSQFQIFLLTSIYQDSR